MSVVVTCIPCYSRDVCRAVLAPLVCGFSTSALGPKTYTTTIQNVLRHRKDKAQKQFKHVINVESLCFPFPAAERFQPPPHPPPVKKEKKSERQVPILPEGVSVGWRVFLATTADCVREDYSLWGRWVAEQLLWLWC